MQCLRISVLCDRTNSRFSPGPMKEIDGSFVCASVCLLQIN